MTFLRIIGKATLLTLITLACIDFTGFLLWAFSGQQPVDDVYVGTATTHLIRHFLPPTQ